MYRFFVKKKIYFFFKRDIREWNKYISLFIYFLSK